MNYENNLMFFIAWNVCFTASESVSRWDRWKIINELAIFASLLLRENTLFLYAKYVNCWHGTLSHYLLAIISPHTKIFLSFCPFCHSVHNSPMGVKKHELCIMNWILLFAKSSQKVLHNFHIILVGIIFVTL